MKPTLVRLLATVTVAFPLIALAASDSSRAPAGQAAAVSSYGKLPLAFEANAGRTDGRVDFIARGNDSALFLTPGEAVLSVGHGKHSAIVRTKLVGASKNRGTPEQRLPGKVNSLIGNDPAKWKRGIATFRQVRYRGAYPGIDLVYYGREGQLEYDFVVKPGADPGRITIETSGRPHLNAQGDLVVPTSAGEVRNQRPVAYQRTADRRLPVSARYVLRGNRISLQVGDYDRSKPLVIDPILAYSTTLGGSGTDTGMSIAAGSDGSAYIAGSTRSTNFPVAGAIDGTGGGSALDAFVTKLSPDGQSVVYSTYIGGSSFSGSALSPDDAAHAIAVDGNGNAWVTGNASSDDFPLVRPWDSTIAGFGEAFLLKLNASGSSLLFSTYFGGNGDDYGNAITLTSSGYPIVAGETDSSNPGTASTGFFISNNGYQQTKGGSTDGFVTRFAPVLCPVPPGTCAPYAPSYSTYLGGTSTDSGEGIAVDRSDADVVYVTGNTFSTAFPTKSPLLLDQTGNDAFLAKLDTTPTAGADISATRDNGLVWSTYVGGAGTDNAADVAVTNLNMVTVVGSTNSTAVPAAQSGRTLNQDTDAPWGSGHPGGTSDFDGFIFEIPTVNTTATWTYVHGSGADALTGVAASTSPNNSTQFIAGSTTSGDLPVQFGLSGQSGTNGENQGFVLKRLAAANPENVWSTYLGGATGSDGAYAIDVDSKNKAYVTGTAGVDFPRVTPVQPLFGGGANDAFVARIDQSPPTYTNDLLPDDGVPVPEDGQVLSGSSAEFFFTLPHANLTAECSGTTAGHVSASLDLTACSGLKKFTGLAEGAHVFDVVSVDDANDRSDGAAARRTFYVDLTASPAFDLIAPANGASTDTHPAFKWQQSHDSVSAVTYHLIIDGKDAGTVSESACADDVCSGQVNPVTVGTHSWSVNAVDAAGHTTASTSTFTFVGASAFTPSFTIAPNPALADHDVTFDASASAADRTITNYRWDLDGDGSFETDAGSSATTKHSYPGAATITVSLQATDAAGTVGTASQQLKISATAITGSLLGVTINSGAQYTKSPDVTVSSVFPAGTTQMLFSNDGGFLAPSPFPPQKDTKWKLDSSGPERLPKTIYVRFFNGPFASETFQDDIILDETPPKVDSAAVTPTATPSSAGLAVASKAKTRKWKAKLKASDSNSGVQYVQLTSNKRKPGKLLKYKKKLTVKSAKKPKWVRARDKAGNYSKWRKAR